MRHYHHPAAIADANLLLIVASDRANLDCRRGLAYPDPADADFYPFSHAHACDAPRGIR